jgi:N utilization substance protein A
VLSRDRDVDCVGACVGMKGMRVQSIIRELRGEKIDIIEYSDDPVVFATHALSPAKISRVSVLDSAEKYMEVIVDDSQLSLAIGKKGQNVRLASKLMGWRIDIKTEEEKRREVEANMASMAIGTPVSVLLDYGLSEAAIEKLIAGGVGSVEKLGAMTPEELLEIDGITEEFLTEIGVSVNAYYQQLESGAQAAGAAPAAEPAAEPAPAATPAEAPAGPAAPAGEAPAAEAAEEAAPQPSAGEAAGEEETAAPEQLPVDGSDTIKSTGLAEEPSAGQ